MAQLKSQIRYKPHVKLGKAATHHFQAYYSGARSRSVAEGPHNVGVGAHPTGQAHTPADPSGNPGDTAFLRDLPG